MLRFFSQLICKRFKNLIQFVDDSRVANMELKGDRISLKNKTAVVTGANSGNGYAILEKLLSLGMKVVGFDIQIDKLKVNLTVKHFDFSFNDNFSRNFLANIPQMCSIVK